MKVLSYRQPWAYLLATGEKNIENRTWKLPKKYIGETILIHASAKPAELKFEIDGQATAHEIELFSALNHCDENELYSAIIGSIQYADCVTNHPSIWAEHWITKPWHNGVRGGFYDVEVYNWVCTNAVLFKKPILDVKGKLSFWDYPMTEEEYLNIEKIQN